MSTSTNKITATVEGNQELVGNIIFRELDNGSVELTLRGHKSNEWHILNSTTIEVWPESSQKQWRCNCHFA
jgi:hypothetical protein